MVIGSTLAKTVNGQVYLDGYRPRDSRKEDIVIIFTEGASEQIQSGTVTVLVFCEDIDPYDNGVMVADGARLEQLEQASLQWTQTLNTNGSPYHFKLASAIASYPYDEDAEQHFVSVQLRYKYFD